MTGLCPLQADASAIITRTYAVRCHRACHTRANRRDPVQGRRSARGRGGGEKIAFTRARAIPSPPSLQFLASHKLGGLP